MNRTIIVKTVIVIQYELTDFRVFLTDKVLELHTVGSVPAHLASSVGGVHAVLTRHVAVLTWKCSQKSSHIRAWSEGCQIGSKVGQKWVRLALNRTNKILS